ncbi:hypothetical protein FOCC_FOCC015241 [Frankliniella occidentalis]|nr:hypothetical protein FOCC_FOCC015241 [Frankliniella occidentalis]
MSISDICPGEDDPGHVDIVEFWSGVWALKTAGGTRVFGDLARYALSALTLPLSNAVVERLFSVMALVKDKIRNKLGLEMLESILRIRTHLHAHGKCCEEFVPTDDMIKNFNSKVMYGERRRSGLRPTPSSAIFEENPEEIDAIPDAGGDGDMGVEFHIGNLEDNAVVPEWDEMFNLLAEVDAVRV